MSRILLGLLFVITTIILLYEPNFRQQVFALSPSFGLQEVKNRQTHWTNMVTGHDSVKGPPYTDIRSVTYFSEGKFLNATLWLSSLKNLTSLNGKPSSDEIRYGMLIDADLNNNTGFQGVDYEVEIKWSNKTNTWTRSFLEYASDGDTRDIMPQQNNYSLFFDKDKNYVKLYVDLNAILSPTRYKVTFYAYSHEGKIANVGWLLDAVRWIYIPPPEFTVSTSPRSIDLTSGEQRTIEVRVNSSTPLTPKIQFHPVSLPKGIRLEFENTTQPQVPTFGVSTTPLTISADAGAQPAPHTLFILADLNLPQESFKIPIIMQGNSEPHTLTKVSGENVMAQTSLMVTVTQSLSWADELGLIWAKFGAFFSFLYLILGVGVHWLYTKHTNRRKRRAEIKHKSKNEQEKKSVESGGDQHS